MTDKQVRCRFPSCHHVYDHHPDQGACDVPWCICRGFRWVPADGPPVGSYDQPAGSAAARH